MSLTQRRKDAKEAAVQKDGSTPSLGATPRHVVPSKLRVLFAPWRHGVHLVSDSVRSSTGRWAFLGAVLLWASVPPLKYGFLAWIAPVPWVWLIRRGRLDGRRPYVALWLAGFAFWLGALHWLRLPHWATSIGWIALAAYFAFYIPVFTALSRVAVHRLRLPVALAAPTVWTGLELARAHLLTGMSMANLGHTQYRWIELIQASDLGGDYAVGFAVMFVAASLARMAPCATDTSGANPRLPVWPLHPALALMPGLWSYGDIRLGASVYVPSLRIALIQGSIDVEMRYDPAMRTRIFEEYFELSREAAARQPRPHLIAWPETMFVEPLTTFDARAARPPEFGGDEAEFRQWLPEAAERGPRLMSQLARSLDAQLLLGVDTNHFGADGVESLNSAVHVARDGRLLGRYDKMHLVMFGEYVPFAKEFPWLQQLTPLPMSATSGRRPEAFDVLGQRIAPNICYESVLSHVIRRQVNTLADELREPDILINLTNDGWFWGSSELDMHLICGVFRAVECRKPFLIAANTGFSAWIDADGRIVRQGPRREKAVILAEPELDRGRRRWYLVHGDWFAGTCLTACGLFGLAGIIGWRRNRPPLQSYPHNRNKNSLDFPAYPHSG